jgi:tetratricopeptide (TPR) repeat protein
MRMQRALSLLLAGTLLAALPSPRTALAQDDWSVKRDPFDKRIIARYKGILAKNPNDGSALRKLIALYRRHRSLDKLIGEYESAAAKKNTFARAMVLGHLYLERGDETAALEQYETAAKLEPDDSGVHLARGELYRRSGRNAEARTAYDQALELTKKDKKGKQAILRALADLSLGEDDIAAAKKYFDEYIALDPKNAQLRIELADALSQHKLYKQAIEALAEAEKRLKSDPATRVDVIARIGAVYEQMDKDDAAIEEYRRAMKLMQRSYHLRRELTERIVEIHRRRQDLPNLITRYEKQWKPASRDHLEWDVLARLYEEIGNQEKAIEAFRKAVKKAPYELDTQRRLISLLENSGREDEALKQYEAVIKVAPGEPRFQLELAERYWNRGKAKQAFALLKKVEKRFPFDAGVQIALADLYSQWGKEKQALEVYVRLTKIEPSEVEHLVTLGEQYFQRGEKDKAIATWKRIAAQKTAAGFARLGDVFAEHDMLPDAEKMYTRAVKAEPKNPARYRGRARVYERLKDHQRAIDDWYKALELTGDKASDRPARREARKRIVALHHTRRGSASLTSAMNKWEAEFRADPPNLESGYFLVEAYLKRRTQGSGKQARKVLERILEIQADDKEAMHLLVDVYRDEQEYELAIGLLERLAEISPGREREFYGEIAELKTLLRKDDEAILYSKKALEKSPNDPAAHEQLAKTYEKMQKDDKAIESYKKTLELDPRNFRVHFRLATLYLRRGKKVEAAELYRAVLRKATDEQVLQRAGRKAIDLDEYMGTLGELERIVAPLAFTFSHKKIYRAILVELYDRYVPRLVDETRSNDDAVAKAAREELARLGQHGLKPLLEALSDEEAPQQQRIAVSVLGHIGNKGAAMPLVRLASGSARSSQPDARGLRIGTLRPTVDMGVRVEALIAAGRLGDERVIPSLIKLMSHREISMRQAATFALGMSGGKDAAKPLLDSLDSNAPTVQMLGCFGLANIRATKHRKAIEAIVTDRRANQRARAACAFALGYLGDDASVTPLLATLDDGNETVQRVAAWSLGRIADKRALSGLMKAYFNKGEDVREAVAWAIPRVAAGKRDTGPVHALGDFPTRTNKYDGDAAIAAMVGPLEPPALSAQLIVGYEDDITRGIRAAIGDKHTNRILRALADLDSRAGGLALGPLTRGLDQADAATRRKVNASLERIGAAVFADVDKLAREHRDPEVRMGAVAVIAKIGTDAAIPVLRAGLSDGKGRVRIAAMAAAAKFVRLHGRGQSALAEAIAELLSADNWEERQAAAEQLGAFGEHAATQPLVAALADRVGFVRQRAAQSLGALDRDDAVDALIAATRDELAGVRLAAVRALVAIGGPKARARLSEIVKTESDDDVKAAARLLK